MLVTRLRAAWRHLFRIRYRLLLVNVLIVAVPLIGVGVAKSYEREMLHRLEQDMINQAQLLRAIILRDTQGMRLGERGRALSLAARHTRTRVRLLDANGAVRADSHVAGPPEGAEAPVPKILGYGARGPRMPKAPRKLVVAQRREVRAALAGRYGAATRLWKSQNRVYLFAALPVANEQGRVIAVVYVTRSTTPVMFAMFRLRSLLFKVLVAALAATVVLSLFLSGTISRPLTALTRASQRIADGSRDEVLRLDRKDEIGDLARTIDKMAHALDERATDAIELAANVSHEFKSPLTSIRGATELLLDGAENEPHVRRHFLENILEDSKRLDRLVSRLLELSRVQHAREAAEAFDYPALIAEALRCSSGTQQVEITYRSSTTQLVGRPRQLRTVLVNLVDNAQQHAATGTVIHVSVCDGPGATVRTIVRNEGVPISNANLNKVWERFFTTRAHAGGTGLGLSIVAAVIRAHGGRVHASSSDAGTNFSYDLPS